MTLPLYDINRGNPAYEERWAIRATVTDWDGKVYEITPSLPNDVSTTDEVLNFLNPYHTHTGHEYADVVIEETYEI